MPAPALHAFPDSLVFTRRLGRALGWPVERIELHHFPDGESLVRVRAEAGARAIVVRSLFEPNEKIIELLLVADALRRAGVASLTLVTPYLAYMRQDRVFQPGEPVSQRVLGALLGASFERVLCVEAHLHRIRSLAEVFPCRAESIPAAALLAPWLEGAGQPLLVGPDAESEPFVRGLAERVGLDWCVGVKRRHGDAEVAVSLPPLSGRSRRALLVDDIVSSGATLAAAAEGLYAQGVERVEAAVVHALFAAGALERLRAAGVARVVSTDTIPHATNQIEAAPCVARALAEEC
jgi:ribose-phosphate pyrophosphokinase